MPIETPEGPSVRMPRDARLHAATATTAYEDLAKVAGDPAIKKARESHAVLQDKIQTSLDRCRELVGAKPVTANGRPSEAFKEDLQRERAEILAPAAKALSVLIGATYPMHLRIAEYVALVATADVSGHFGVGVLLESFLANQMTFIERTRRPIWPSIESKHAVRLAA